MFLYEKKIIYLSRYQNGVREAPAGFVKFLREKNAIILDIHIRSDHRFPDGNYTLSLVIKNKEIAWDTLPIKGGSAAIPKQITLRDEMICIGQDVYEEDKLHGILLHIDGQSWIAGYFKEWESTLVIEDQPEVMEISEQENSLHAADDVSQHKFCIQKDCLKDEKVKVEELISENKWEQLKKSYQKVHPFGDERMFISIEPKDFVILQASYQKLVNNSFLLHGFYNYRHLILGPDKNLGNEAGERFYLGVPGTYFEREKMVAVMFGFEGFECNGAVEIGKFGYYMRRVEL